MGPGADGVLEPMRFNSQLQESLPELPRIAEVEICSLMAKDSSDVVPDDWVCIAEQVRSCYSEYDGFVVVHGTDTMSYTASALSFILPTLSKPIVFTGSQRPMHEPRSDARVNLVDAVKIATMGVAEVTVCLHSMLLRGNRSRKRSTTDYRAFESPNFPPLGTLGVKIDLSDEILAPRGAPGMPLPSPHALERRVSQLFLSPATRPEEILAQREMGTRGLILGAFGAGNLPVRDDRLLRAIQQLGIPTVVLSQCYHGPVDLRLYQGGLSLLEGGVIDGGEMTPEAALTKLMAGLGVGLRDDELRKYMLSSVAGERRSRATPPPSG